MGLRLVEDWVSNSPSAALNADVASGVVLEWPLVGRADELALVEHALAHPGSQGVVLAGAAGVGKTRLAQELLARASRTGRATAWVQATRSAREIPFGAFAHLLPRDLGESGPANLLGVAGETVTGRGSGGQLVLCVDDAHLLDSSSAALMRHLAVSASCFVMATVRSREPIPDAVVSLWKDGPLERIELQSLSKDEVVELLHGALGGHVDGWTLHRLWEASRGNPLYLREVVLGGLDAEVLTLVHGVWRWGSSSLATPRLTELVESRLGDLSPAERRALEIVAHAEPIEMSFLNALSARAELESLERRGLLEALVSERRRAMRLSHPLYAEAVRAVTPSSTIKAIRHRLADLLEAAGARRAGDLLRLATWRLDAGDRADAELFVTASREASGLQDFALAERLARAAIDIAAEFESRFVLATALVGLSHYDDAEILFADVEQRAESDEQRARVALRRSDNLFGPLGRGAEAVAVLAHALDHVSSPLWRAALVAARARHQLFGNNAVDALRAVDEIDSHLMVEPQVMSEVIAAVTWGRIVTGRPRETLQILEGVHRTIPEPPGHYATTAPDVIALGRCTAEVVLGHLTAAEGIGRDAYERSKATGAHVQRGVLGFAYGSVLRVTGRIRAAIEVLTDGASVLREIDFYRQYSACVAELAHCHALLGDVSAANAALAEAEAARVPSFTMDYSYVTGAKTWVAQASRERTHARQLAREWAEGCASHGQMAFEAFAWHDLARLGDPAAATGPLGSIAARVDGELIPMFAAHAAALAAGDAVGLDRVGTAFEQMGAVLYAAEAAALAAVNFRDEGRTGSAFGAAARARHLAELCEGARTPALETIDATLPLTAREREIASLAARGLSNRAIAEELVVSVRTVDNHLHNAYAKLGITKRAELDAILHPASGGDRI